MELVVEIEEALEQQEIAAADHSTLMKEKSVEQPTGHLMEVLTFLMEERFAEYENSWPLVLLRYPGACRRRMPRTPCRSEGAQRRV